MTELIVRHRFRYALLSAVFAGSAFAACAFDKVALPASASRVVVHGVLNPGIPDQVVLVERSLTGASLASRVAYDSLDPIVADGGSPIRNARVVVFNTRGDSVVLREDAVVRSDGKGAGVYRFENLPGATLPTDLYAHFVVTPGEQYSLRVRTTDGEVIAGATLVPQAPGTIVAVTPRQFDRDRDSMFLGWPDVSRSTRFELRVESPSGAYLEFVDSLEYLVSGSLVLANATGRPRVFWPGFRQVLTVSAVDANYHDYYRSGSDPFTSRGLLVHLTGGVGVFGSITRVRERTVDVIGSTGESPSGRWDATTTVGGNAPSSFRLWRESASSGATRLTGTVLGLSISAPPQAVASVLTGNKLTVTVLRQQSLRDTLVTLDGTIDNGGATPLFTATVRGNAAAGTIIYRLSP